MAKSRGYLTKKDFVEKKIELDWSKVKGALE
jgi:hypothetical protein